MKYKLTLFLLLICCAIQQAGAASLPGIPEFIDEMVAKHHFKRAELERAFDQAQYLPAVIDAISRPATSRPWPEYRASFVNPERIRLGVKFWKEHRTALLHAERKYGVPREIILAVIGVETVYGRDAGTFRILDALTTLAFDYPPRADFFRSELENYLLLARDQQFDLLSVRGSYAGALGIPQFMPSSYRNYAVDSNGNKRIDLINETNDAIYSVANYLKNYGWQSRIEEGAAHQGASGKPYPIAVAVRISGGNGATESDMPRTITAWEQAGVVPDISLKDFQGEQARLIDFTVNDGKEFWLVLNNFDVIKHYNNSDYYAMTVFQLAEEVKSAFMKTRPNVSG